MLGRVWGRRRGAGALPLRPASKCPAWELPQASCPCQRSQRKRGVSSRGRSSPGGSQEGGWGGQHSVPPAGLAPHPSLVRPLLTAEILTKHCFGAPLPSSLNSASRVTSLLASSLSPSLGFRHSFRGKPKWRVVLCDVDEARPARALEQGEGLRMQSCASNLTRLWRNQPCQKAPFRRAQRRAGFPWQANNKET